MLVTFESRGQHDKDQSLVFVYEIRVVDEFRCGKWIGLEDFSVWISPIISAKGRSFECHAQLASDDLLDRSSYRLIIGPSF
jgi:hypothetical protein